ncbi:ThuA domain-containing protein [Singulisphaera acidiphila]|uniref:Trehalose utilization protein n=1 Tax=Singulisphaera acidiphila (strain ATCC BAA-1392 / DSM 18658 / VKM B-2454 / MOB10) TaxID=886293 RepID=L0DQ99_SINAD|nr:ThuA domain-containing protein [Singulisphaera acidiphila]AGA31053.1 trehalose utilization protein [Singulisphaera acidiphila DSM 18658]
MSSSLPRRDFLKRSAAALSVPLLPAASAALAAGQGSTVKVVVWDERQPAQKEAYPNFLGNAIADHLRAQPGFSVKSVGMDDPEHGLSAEVLGDCDVLIWWGHVRHREIAPETVKPLIERIKAGTLSLIALHSAHWSTPFVEAMNERTRLDVEARYRQPGDGSDRVEIEYIPAKLNALPKADARPTPYVTLRKFPDGLTKVTVQLPLCVFPAYRHDGKPSDVRILKPSHPIVNGVPERFAISQTEMYDETFHVPEPDEVILEERWGPGEWFRSGMVWKVGQGRVFYFRPGHETYPVFREELPLKIVANAARWLPTKPT